jgi:CheY-like chemotaxis protein
MSEANNEPILYVEDSEDDVFLMKYAFERAEVKNPIEIVRDGQEAVEFLSRFLNDAAPRRQLSLVLLDLKLPKKTGLEVLEWMRQQPPLKKIPTLIFSSSNQKADVERAYEYGANAFLVKPSDPQTLQDMVKAIKHFWLTHNQLPE